MLENLSLYLDPGMWSAIGAVILGGITASVMYLRVKWAQIKSKFSKNN